MSDISRIGSYAKQQGQSQRRPRAEEDFSVQGGGTKASKKAPVQANSEAYQLSISRDAIEASREYQRKRLETEYTETE